jgi:prolipoprotein diacylglyceryltransferase
MRLIIEMFKEDPKHVLSIMMQTALLMGVSIGVILIGAIII